MQGFELKINIYANNEEEVEEARAALIGFIRQHAKEGRAVSAKKITGAVQQWDKNPFVRNRIIEYLKK